VDGHPERTSTSPAAPPAPKDPEENVVVVAADDTGDYPLEAAVGEERPRHGTQTERQR